MDSVSMSWMATAFLLSSAILLLPSGRWADLHGKKHVFLWGGVVFAAASFLLALASSSIILIGLRAVQGFGAGMVWATATAILVAAFPVEQRGMVLGINSAAIFLGYTAGPFLGGLLTQHLGWRSIFLAIVPVATLITLYGIRKLADEPVRAGDQRFDIEGSIILGIALIALIYGFGLLPAFSGVWLALIGVAGLVAFGLWETRRVSPLFDVTILKRNRIFALGNFAVLTNFSATFGISYLMSLYLQYIQGLSAQEAGLLMIANPLMQAVSSPVAGWLSDRVQPRLVSAAGLVLAAACLFGLSQLSPETPLPWIIVDLALLGFTLAMVLTPNANAVMTSVDKSLYGIASAVSGMVRVVGQMSSMAIAMVVFGIFLGRVAIAPQNYSQLLQSTRVAFVIFGLLCVCGFWAMMAMPNLPRRRAATRVAPEAPGNLDLR
jgi:EmrB/QacA subfamily drug resistance transporter